MRSFRFVLRKFSFKNLLFHDVSLKELTEEQEGFEQSLDAQLSGEIATTSQAETDATSPSAVSIFTA